MPTEPREGQELRQGLEVVPSSREHYRVRPAILPVPPNRERDLCIEWVIGQLDRYNVSSYRLAKLAGIRKKHMIDWLHGRRTLNTQQFSAMLRVLGGMVVDAGDYEQAMGWRTQRPADSPRS